MKSIVEVSGLVTNVRYKLVNYVSAGRITSLSAKVQCTYHQQRFLCYNSIFSTVNLVCFIYRYKPLLPQAREMKQQ